MFCSMEASSEIIQWLHALLLFYFSQKENDITVNREVALDVRMILLKI